MRSDLLCTSSGVAFFWFGRHCHPPHNDPPGKSRRARVVRLNTVLRTSFSISRKKSGIRTARPGRGREKSCVQLRTTTHTTELCPDRPWETNTTTKLVPGGTRQSRLAERVSIGRTSWMAR